MSRAPNTVFICGFPSSGTDLLKNIINAHREIYIGGEFPLLPALAERHDGCAAISEPEAAARDIVGCDIYGNLRNTSLPEGFEAGGSFAEVYVALLTSEVATWCGNKTPQNAEHVDKLERLFPNSRYLLIVRDVRDVALSWKNKWGKDPLLCAHKWAMRMRLAVQRLNALSQDRYLILKYEELLDDFRAVAGRVCEFLSLPYDAQIDSFHEHVQEIVPGKLNYGQPVLPDNKAKWHARFDQSTVRRIEEIAFEALMVFDYKPSAATRTVPITPKEKLLGRVREVAAAAFVGNRADRAQLGGRLWQVVRLELAKRVGRYRV